VILEQSLEIERSSGLKLAYLALADSRGLVFAPGGLTDGEVMGILAAKAQGRSLDRLPAHVTAAQLAQGKAGGGVQDEMGEILTRQLPTCDVRLLVDVTAAESTDELLARALHLGWGVVLANKHPLVGCTERARPLLDARGRRLRYEATVGAGLPVIATLQTLLDSGDEVQHIDGCFSGTLGFLCHCLERGQPFSTSVREAKSLGYTEPDARQDLSGMDVARKALILARSCGQDMELGDVEVEPLFPAEMRSLTAAQFMDSLESLDGAYRDRISAARDRGRVLRYVASVEDDRCRVGWREVEREDIMAALQGPDNMVRYHTRRYAGNPLVLIGPGAGPERTAAGVLADILDLASHSAMEFGQE
jgi:homoserine dehydrogenase